MQGREKEARERNPSGDGKEIRWLICLFGQRNGEGKSREKGKLIKILSDSIFRWSLHRVSQLHRPCRCRCVHAHGNDNEQVPVST